MEIEDRLKQIEQRLSALEAKQRVVSPPPPPARSKQQAPVETPKPNSFIQWLFKDPLVKLGMLLLLLAAGWFASLAFVSDWLGPAGRLSILAILSGAAYGGGLFLSRSRSAAGQAVAATGMAGGLITLWAAQALYQYLSIELTFALMALIVGVTIVLGTMRNLMPFTTLGVVAAALVPWVAHAPLTGLETPLILYLLLYNLAASYSASIRGWRVILPLPLAATIFYFEEISWIYFLPYALPVLVATYFLYKVPLMLHLKRGKDLLLSDVVIYIVLYGALSNWTYDLVIQPYHYVIYGAALLPLGYAAWLLGRYGREALPLETVNLLLLLYFTISAVPAEHLSYEQVLMVNTLLFAAAYLFYELIVGKKQTSDAMFGFSLIPPLLILTGFGFFVGFDLSGANGSLLSARNVACLLAAAVLFGTSRIYGEKGEKLLLNVAYGLIGLLLIELAWNFIFALIPLPQLARTIALSMVGGVSTALIFRRFQTAGYLLFGLLILRLLLVDYSLLTLPFRITTFALLGVMMVSTAFVRKGESGESS